MSIWKPSWTNGSASATSIGRMERTAEKRLTKLSGKSYNQQIRCLTSNCTLHNNQRYHESLANLTPADAYFGRAQTILKQRERIKRKTIKYRRLQHRKLAA